MILIWNQFSHPSDTMKDQTDRDQLFLLYMMFCGDAHKTAHAAGVGVLTVATMAKDNDWDKKLGEISALRNSDRPGDLERAINRAINYADAHRYRRHLQRVLAHFQSMTDEQIEALLITETFDKNGILVKRTLSTRALADLSSALEKAHALTYLALGDTAQDRARRKEESDDGVMAASALNQQIIAAMAKESIVSIEETPKRMLEEAQVERAAEIAKDKLPSPPVDSTSVENDEPTEFNIPPLPEPKKPKS